MVLNVIEDKWVKCPPFRGQQQGRFAPKRCPRWGCLVSTIIAWRPYFIFTLNAIKKSHSRAGLSIMSLYWAVRYFPRLRKLIKSAVMSGSSRLLTVGVRQYRVSGLFETRMYFDIQRESWTDRPYVAALSAKNGTFIDVGANVGQTLLKLLSVDAERRYIGFEPQVECSFYLSQFIRENHLRAHAILPIGLSNQTGIVQLRKRDDQADVFASTIDGFRPNDFYIAREHIYVARGDDVLSAMRVDEISTIKIDVEGGELEVIEGMQTVLRDKAPFIFFEVLGNFEAAIGKHLDDGMIAFREQRNQRLLRLLHHLGYSVFNIRPGNKILEISSFNTERAGNSDVDYIAVHRRHRTAFFDNYEGAVISRKHEG